MNRRSFLASLGIGVGGLSAPALGRSEPNTVKSQSEGSEQWLPGNIGKQPTVKRTDFRFLDLPGVYYEFPEGCLARFVNPIYAEKEDYAYSWYCNREWDCHSHRYAKIKPDVRSFTIDESNQVLVPDCILVEGDIKDVARLVCTKFLCITDLPVFAIHIAKIRYAGRVGLPRETFSVFAHRDICSPYVPHTSGSIYCWQRRMVETEV